MNPILQLQSAHVSVRSFRPDPVDDALLERCLRAAQRAASSHNVQAYSVLRVRDPQQRSRLAALAGDQRHVLEAPILLLVCADARRHRLLCERAGTPFHSNLESFLVAVIDAALFAQNLALALESEGLSICYVGGLRDDLFALDACLNVPRDVFPLFGLCAGHAAELPARRERLPLEAFFHDGAWSSDEAQLAAIEHGDELGRAAALLRAKPARAWSGMVTRLFGRTQREALAGYYRSKGARLD